MKKKFIWILLCIIPIISFSQFQFKKGRLIVQEDNIAAYPEFNSSEIAKRIPYGILLTALEFKHNRIKVNYQEQDLWINEYDVQNLSFNIKNFSTNLSYFTANDDIKDHQFWFFYKEALYYIQLDKGSVKKAANIPYTGSLTSSLDRNLWLLTGNTDSYLNLALYDLQGKRFLPISTYRNASLSSASFSENNQFIAALLHKESENNYLIIFNTESGAVYESIRNVEAYVWAQNKLLVFTKKEAVLITPQENKKETLKTYTNSNSIEFAWIGGKLFIEIDNIIYLYQDNVLTKTSYKSIERSNNDSLERYTKGEQIITLFNGSKIYSLSGTNPRWEFDSFLDNNEFLYKYKDGAITSLYRYNLDEEKSYQYRWVEEPFARLNNGFVLEIVEDKDKIWIFTELAESNAQIYRLEELLK